MLCLASQLSALLTIFRWCIDLACKHSSFYICSLAEEEVVERNRQEVNRIPPLNKKLFPLPHTLFVVYRVHVWHVLSYWLFFSTPPLFFPHFLSASTPFLLLRSVRPMLSPFVVLSFLRICWHWFFYPHFAGMACTRFSAAIACSRERARAHGGAKAWN